MELGFHWRVCVHALSASGGDVEAAANALFAMESTEDVVSEWEVCGRVKGSPPLRSPIVVC